jgi:hypothetical protein
VHDRSVENSNRTRAKTSSHGLAGFLLLRATQNQCPLGAKLKNLAL